MKTKNYDQFIFRDDNRCGISTSHVQRLIESIKSRNLLEFRPVIVNSNMEVLDGQHRILAAKALGIDVYYEINKKDQIHDLILMNINKAWRTSDFLNFYCKNGYTEYVKFQEFCKKNDLKIKAGMLLLVGQTRSKIDDFKTGKFVFPKEDNISPTMDILRETIDIIKKYLGHSPFTTSGKFLKSLISLLSHPEFEKQKWKKNLSTLITKVGARATTKDYITLFAEIYNWKNHSKIDLLNQEY